MNYVTLQVAVRDGIASIALDQPDTRNALSDALLGDLHAALVAVRDDDEVRVVVLRSTHEKVFSSGASLSGFAAEVPLVRKHEEIRLLPSIFELLGKLGKPSICAAGGHVLAGAVGLACACDLVIAKQGIGIGTPEVNIGAFPFMVTAMLEREIGRKRMAELMLLGERIDAAEAERIGLVNKVVPEADFDDAVDAWATALAAKSPLLMRLGKDAMYEEQDLGFESSLAYLRGQLTLAFSTEDLHEGVTAFFDKREPRWTGR
ncbi:MAG TPA: enoyl-CoA hydratase-related protein [Solirubrobacterales bacterium]|jgi:enoyl-CoA hydratase/carnithine racemase|nr:enoyl-CoA hydratase-related protein [Solirubrobacterales bacterium]